MKTSLNSLVCAVACLGLLSGCADSKPNLPNSTFAPAHQDTNRATSTQMESPAAAAPAPAPVAAPVAAVTTPTPTPASTITASAMAPASTPSTNTASAEPVVVRVNRAIIPQLNAGYMAHHSNNVVIAQKGDIDVLFMGDSITDFWQSEGRRRGGPAATNAAAAIPDTNAIPYAGKAVFEKHFGSWKVANFGIAGDTTQGVLWRLRHGEGSGYKPKAIMLMIGTNNTGRNKNTGNTAEEIAMGVADIVFELRQDFPDAKILLLGIFPRATPISYQRAEVSDINKIIAALNDGQHVFYKDIGNIFLADDGTIPRDIMSDGLHPTSKGYELWAQAVEGTLAGWLQ